MEKFEQVKRRVLTKLTDDLQKACDYWKKGCCWSESFIDEMAWYNNMISEAYYAEDMDNMSESLERIFKQEAEIMEMFEGVK